MGPADRTSGSAHGLILLLTIYLAAGCQSPADRAISAASIRLPASARIGIISPSSAVNVDTSELPWAPESRSAGVAQGAVEGFLAGALECSIWAPIPILLPACLTFGGAIGIAGAIAGHTAATQAGTVNAARDSFANEAGNAAIHQALRERVIQLSLSGPYPPLFDLGTRTATGAQVAGPSAGMDYLIEVTVTEARISSTSPGQFAWTVRAASTINDVRNGKPLGQHDHLFIGPAMTLEDWEKNNAGELRKLMMNSLNVLAADVLNRCCQQP